MKHVLSSKRAMGSPIGPIHYRVVQDGDVASIEVSEEIEKRLVERKADVTPLRHLGHNEHAWKVMRKLIRSLKPQKKL